MRGCFVFGPLFGFLKVVHPRSGLFSLVRVFILTEFLNFLKFGGGEIISVGEFFYQNISLLIGKTG
jgi:hypothetical protein